MKAGVPQEIKERDKPERDGEGKGRKGEEETEGEEDKMEKR